MLITRNKTIEVLSETNPDKREIAECGKKAMQEICNKWIKDFANVIPLHPQIIIIVMLLINQQYNHA